MQALRLCTSSLRRHSCGGCAAAAQILSTSSHPVRASQRHSTSPSSSLPSSENEAFHERDLKGSTQESEDSTTVGSAGADACNADVDAEAKRLEARDAIIREILSRDKVIFELKRQHELSMLRVEQNQARVLKDQEDRGMYYEQNSNVHTFDTISVGLYSQRSTLYHTMSAERLRNLKVFLMVLSTVVTCVYLYYRYMINPDWAYVERPIKMLGSRVLAIREQRWKHLSEAQRFDALRDEKNEAA
ncbi:hypothetical protein, conserved [Leishmania tarentolae]|uniref:Transmembrane protein n=1 Tax=Leishmania tarentolae TaxID=5689 RepID=A0A640KSW9_LEITA|nr:hypothetical protein, conserved [Leishmania tarentolae]